MNRDCSTNRRRFLHSAAGGAAAVVTGGSLRDRLLQAARQEGGHPLAPRRGHAAARATSLIIVNLTGGLSHIDSFDHKPRLQADHGKTIDWRGRPFFLNASPFRFRFQNNRDF